MKERPILFNAPMVRALLAGTKTQTRRIVKPVKFYPDFGCAVGQVGGAWKYGSPAALGLRERGDHWSIALKGDVLQRMCTSEAYGWGAGAGCPYGVPGDRLWVRETWRTDARLDDKAPNEFSGWPVKYEADSAVLNHGAFFGQTDGKTRTSIHMPRWASRITLEVNGVRVERLQDIDLADALAEGISDTGALILDRAGNEQGGPIAEYAVLWEQINGPGSWDANPWVWVLDFKGLP